MYRSLFLCLLALPAMAEESTLVTLAQDADYVVIGERHDNPDHHRIQAEVVAALRPDALAFEMLPRSAEDAVNALRAQGRSGLEIGDAIGWAELGWPSWRDYAPILDAAPDALVIGGAVARDVIARVRESGPAAAGFDAGYGLDAPLDPAVQEAMLAEQVAAHCDMVPAAALGGMVAVQRVWDVAYAEAMRRGRALTGGQVVLITGNGHARRDRGAPAALLRVEPDADIVSIGLLESGDEAGAMFDAVAHAPPPEREDPCAAFERMSKP